MLGTVKLAAADEPVGELPRFRAGVEGLVTVAGDSTGAQLGLTGDVLVTEPLAIRARVGYGRLTPNHEEPDPSETVTILRAELGVELRKHHGSHAFFAGLHGGVQRMSGGWIRMTDRGTPYAFLIGGQFGFELSSGRVRFRFGFDISHWRFVDASGTDESPYAEVGYAF